MLKRLLVVVLLLTMAVALVPNVAAQGGDFDCGTDGEVTITFIAGTVGGEHEVYVALAEEYMADVCPNVKVNVVERPQSTTETLAQYQQFFAAQSGEIDIYMVDVVWPAMIAEHLVDVNEYLDADTLSRFYPAVLDAYTVQGRLVAMPWFAAVCCTTAVTCWKSMVWKCRRPGMIWLQQPRPFKMVSVLRAIPTSGASCSRGMLTRA